MKKIILALSAAGFVAASSAAFAQSAGVGIPNLNVDAYWLYNGQGSNIYAQAQFTPKAHHASKKLSDKRAAHGQNNKM